VPLYDARGALRSLHARDIGIVEAGRPKAVTGKGTSTKGLVMADPLGREVLALGRLPDWWMLGRPLRVVISEGEPDWLTWATRYGDGDAESPACLGIIGGGHSGSWTPELGRRLPARSQVFVRTDLDKPGEQYASAIARSIGHCRVSRKVDHAA
jgi:hypothetical protein